jgi:AcrR family transcriptional regulator
MGEPATANVTGGAGGEPGGSSGGVVSLEALVDGAFEAMAGDGLLEGVEGIETTGADGEPSEGLEAPQDGAEEPEEASEGDEAEEPTTKGTKTDPFKVTDLPDDRFVQVKIDGKLETIPLRELGDGYIRDQTFRRAFNETRQATQHAEAIAQRAVEWQRETKAQIGQVMSNPDMLYDYFTANPQREQVLAKAATKYAQLVAQERQDPTARARRETERERARLEAERRRFDEERNSVVQERQQSEAVAARQRELAPGWVQGLKEAGLVGAQVTDELRTTVRGLLVAKTQSTRKPATAEDMREAVVKAARILDVKAPPKPKPAVVQPRERVQQRQPANGNGKKPRAGSVDAIMASLTRKPRF